MTVHIMSQIWYKALHKGDIICTHKKQYLIRDLQTGDIFWALKNKQNIWYCLTENGVLHKSTRFFFFFEIAKRNIKIHKGRKLNGESINLSIFLEIHLHFLYKNSFYFFTMKIVWTLIIFAWKHMRILHTTLL